VDERPTHAVEQEHAEAEMADRKVVVLVEREPVGSAEAARELDENADLGHATVGHERQAPDRIGTRDRDEELAARLVEHETVGARHRVDQAVEPAPGRQAIDATRGIVQAGLSLVGEIEVAVRRDMQVVRPLEAFAAIGLDERRDAAAPRIESHDAALVIGDHEAPSIGMQLHAVRPAIVFGDERPRARRRDAEDAPERDIDHVEIARAVEAWALEKAPDRLAAAVVVCPLGALAVASETLGHARELAGHDLARRCKRHHDAPGSV